MSTTLPSPPPATTPSSYNCFSKEQWTPAKVQWCCENQKLGCQPPSAPAGEDVHMCCMAIIAECLACAQSVDVAAYCALPENSDIPGCADLPALERTSLPTSSPLPPLPLVPPPSPSYVYNDESTLMCCKAPTAECLACAQGVSVAAYCAMPEAAEIFGCAEGTLGSLDTNGTHSGLALAAEDPPSSAPPAWVIALACIGAAVGFFICLRAACMVPWCNQNITRARKRNLLTGQIRQIPVATITANLALTSATADKV